MIPEKRCVVVGLSQSLVAEVYCDVSIRQFSAFLNMSVMTGQALKASMLSNSECLVSCCMAREWVQASFLHRQSAPCEDTKQKLNLLMYT
jgi:hypothetical protein